MSRADFTAIGIDVGGTKIAAGLVSFPGGKVQAERRVLTEGGSGAVLDQLCQIATELQDQGRSSGLQIGGIGLGLCEIVRRDGTIASSATFQCSETELHKRLSSIAAVVIEADVRAAARAEAFFGAGRGLDCFLYVSIGTGISCCLVIDGEPFTGARGATGTMASGPLPSLDLSASHVSLEEVASGPALRDRFNALGGKVRGAEEVLAAAAQGNKEALQVVQSGASALGAAIGWLVNVLDPRVVILGGGLGLSEGVFRETLINSAREHIWWPGHREAPILPAQTGANAGVIGAAAAAWTSRSKNSV